MRLSIAEVNFALRPAFTIFSEYRMCLSIAEVNFALRPAFTIFSAKVRIFKEKLLFLPETIQYL